MLRDLLDIAAGLAVIGGAVGVIVLFGREPADANDHDVTDYREPAAIPVPRRPWAELDVDGPAIRPAAALTGPVRLAAADGPVPPLARALLIRQAVPRLSDAAIRATADDWLREIAAEQQARAGIRLRSSADRDMTGAFPVVAVA